jgi:hypothetical protein
MMVEKMDLLYKKLLSESTQKKSERIILTIAIISFIAHLAIICSVNLGLVHLSNSNPLLESPIAAIYTPFSFILIYEVYLLIFYLPKSLSIYISKQYEIIMLIVIRRLFKDLSNLKISSDWFALKHDLQFTYDLITSLVLFYFIYLFLQLSKKRPNENEIERIGNEGTIRYIRIKKTIATFLVPLLILLAGYSFSKWIIDLFMFSDMSSSSFKNINNIFFEAFFSVLIIIDVVVLLVSFFYTDEFHKVIRNSGFVISTILIRLSFSVEGLLNNVLIIAGILFGLLILIIHNKFETFALSEKVEKRRTD